MSAGGLAAVWRSDNNRQSMVAAMKRRETYATTGPRIVVCLFPGCNFSLKDAASPDLAAIGYDGGVPMGGELSNAPDGAAPHFLIAPAKDYSIITWIGYKRLSFGLTLMAWREKKYLT